jgi:hypothetical protein
MAGVWGEASPQVPPEGAEGAKKAAKRKDMHAVCILPVIVASYIWV